MPQRTNDLALHSSLRDLRANFLATSTLSMPIAGMLFWAIVAVAALRLNPNQLSLLVLFGSGTIFPLGMLIDRLTQRRVTVASAANPVTQMFMQSLGLVALTWPLVILAARHAHDANLIVLGGAILMGIIWIPYGWAADDPVGLQHAIGRGLFSYVAFVYVPSPYKATGISCVVLLAYLYSLLRMKRPPKDVTGR
ncbi:MAG: hypothetical protein QOJ42_584 [Acidobacteriaceae bacterium]|nr:hypothetical protein [Acidobacteriaceae bacterium]